MAATYRSIVPFLYVDPMMCRPVASYTGVGVVLPKITSSAFAYPCLPFEAVTSIKSGQ